MITKTRCDSPCIRNEKGINISSHQRRSCICLQFIAMKASTSPRGGQANSKYRKKEEISTWCAMYLLKQKEHKWNLSVIWGYNAPSSLIIVLGAIDNQIYRLKTACQTAIAPELLKKKQGDSVAIELTIGWTFIRLGVSPLWPAFKSGGFPKKAPNLVSIL